MRLTAAALVSAAAIAVPAATAHAAAPTFAPFTQYATPSGFGPGPAPVTTVAADFTGDGKPDIASTANFGQTNVLLLRNNGNGAFAPATAISGTAGAQSLGAADLDGDGKQDLAAMTAQGVRIYKGNGAGGFSAFGSYAAILGGQLQVQLADLNGDGRQDIAVPTFTAVQTLINNGNGTFHAGTTTQLPGSGAVSALSQANLNGDGYDDLFAVDGFSGTLFALKGSASGTLSISGRVYATGLVPEDVAAIDLNGDGADDAAVIGSFSFTVATVLTNGSGSFGGALVPSYQSGGAGPTSIGARDLNADGRTDLVVSDVANPAAPSVLVLTGNGTVTPTPSGEFGVARLPQDPAIADYDSDGRPDIAVAGPGTLSVLLDTTP